VSASFELHGAGMRYGAAQVLAGVDLRLSGGSLTAVVGPNGAGKSTLLNILAGLRPNYTGKCRLDGIEVRRWSRRAFAQRVSFVPQATRIEFPFTAEEVALMGRAPHAAGLFESAHDRQAVHDAMELTDTLHLRARDFRSLSGGEQQRVILAAALAQSPGALLLDEPTTFLDVGHQLMLYRILRSLCERGILVAAVTHDLNLAAAYANRVIVLQEGHVVADGPPEEAFRTDRLREVFGVPAELLQAPDGRHWIRYGD
jgi:ABC-type cobalamin/Fe3+-siderophores transport system ATPase subunit